MNKSERREYAAWLDKLYREKQRETGQEMTSSDVYAIGYYEGACAAAVKAGCSYTWSKGGRHEVLSSRCLPDR